jgi:hypothetical protein
MKALLNKLQLKEDEYNLEDNSVKNFKYTNTPYNLPSLMLGDVGSGKTYNLLKLI